MHVYNTPRINELHIPGASFVVNCFRELKSTSAASSSQYNQIIVKRFWAQWQIKKFIWPTVADCTCINIHVWFCRPWSSMNSTYCLVGCVFWPGKEGVMYFLLGISRNWKTVSLLHVQVVLVSINVFIFVWILKVWNSGHTVQPQERQPFFHVIRGKTVWMSRKPKNMMYKMWHLV
jgi:hypothetical protein